MKILTKQRKLIHNRCNWSVINLVKTEMQEETEERLDSAGSRSCSQISIWTRIKPEGRIKQTPFALYASSLVRSPVICHRDSRFYNSGIRPYSRHAPRVAMQLPEQRQDNSLYLISQNAPEESEREDVTWKCTRILDAASKPRNRNGQGPRCRHENCWLRVSFRSGNRSKMRHWRHSV